MIHLGGKYGSENKKPTKMAGFSLGERRLYCGPGTRLPRVTLAPKRALRGSRELLKEQFTP